MAGGYRRDSRRSARRLATGVLGGIVFAAPGLAAIAEGGPDTQPAAAAPASAPRRSERSIIVETGKAASPDSGVALATDHSEGALEPIANPSEYGVEPDLAEDAVAGLVPDLADPPVPGDDQAPSYVASDDEPAGAVAPADDAGLGEELAPPPPMDDEVIVTDDFGAATVYQAAAFNGLIPGESTRADALAAWGQPLEQSTAAKTLTFEVEGFQSVSLTFRNDVVASIRVELSQAAPAAELADKLALADYRPAYTRDDGGHVVSTTYPERGVTFGHAPALGAAVVSDKLLAAAGDGSERVYEIVMRPIEGAAFVRRAQSMPASEYVHRAADLQAALDLDRTNAAARLALAEAKLAVGEAQLAENLAAEAVKGDPANDAYRLQWAKCLKALGRYDQALEQTRAILEGTTATPIVRADALETMAQLAAIGPPAQRTRALSLHSKAIELADKLAADQDASVRARAHQVLLSAHLGMGECIAAGDFQNRDQSVEQWLTRASALAEHMIAAGEADVSLRVQVAVSALAAGGRLNPPVDPALWIAEADEAAEEAKPRIADAKARDNLHWQLGLAYSLAAEIQHRLGAADLAISYGELADANMTPQRDSRRELPDADYALGRVYFQIGAAHAVHKHDHDAACQWYDRAADLLLSAPPESIASPGQHGDALVSMGVSYWEIGQRDRAYELTKAGSEMVARGVAEGLLAQNSLAVPQGNLAAMAQALGISPAAPADDVGPTRLTAGKRPAQQMSRAKNAPRMAGRNAMDNAARRR